MATPTAEQHDELKRIIEDQKAELARLQSDNAKLVQKDFRTLAERDRLRASEDALVKTANGLQAELARLREELANTHGGDGTVHHVSAESQAALYAERDRLREKNNRLVGEAAKWETAYNGASAERDTLRRELEQERDEYHQLMLSRDEMQTERDRLREENEELHNIAEQATLRGQEYLVKLARLREDLTEAREDVQYLRRRLETAQGWPYGFNSRGEGQ